MNKSFDVPSSGTAHGATLAPRDVSATLIDYSAILVTLWRRKVLIALGGVVAACIAGAVLLNMDSVYAAKSEVLLDTRERQIINIQNVVDDAQYSDGGILSEIAIIRSAPLRREVARRLDLAQYEEFNPSPDSGGILTAIEGAVRGLFVSSDGGDGGPPPSPVYIAADILQDKVTVSQLGLSYILQIQVVASSPSLAADIANTLAQVYLDSQVEGKIEANEDATEWLAKRADELRKRVEEVETDYERTRASLVLDGRLSAETVGGQIAELSSYLIQTRSARALAEARANRFERLIAEGDIEAAMRIAASDTLAGLVNRRDNLREQRNALSRASGNTTAGDGAMAVNLATVNARIMEEARSLLLGLRTEEAIIGEQVEALQADLNELELRLVDQSDDMVDLRALEREVEAQRSVYQTFLTRLTEARERGDFQEADARIVSRAEPPGGAAGPKRKLLTLVAFVFGAGALTAFVLFQEARKDVFRTASDAEGETGLPVLATLTQRTTDWRGRPRSPAPSTWRAMQRLMLMLGPQAHGSGKAILVTSVLPKEGADNVSFLLAQACVAAGWRVTVVDLDEPGSKIRESLSDRSAAEGPDSGFDVLTIPERLNSADSGFSAGTLAAGIAELRRDRDVVVVHAPAVLAAAEPLALAGAVDHVLLAFRWERTPRGAIAEACEELVRLRAPLAGLVMTETNPKIAAQYAYPGASYVRRLCARQDA